MSQEPEASSSTAVDITMPDAGDSNHQSQPTPVTVAVKSEPLDDHMPQPELQSSPPSEPPSTPSRHASPLPNQPVVPPLPEVGTGIEDDDFNSALGSFEQSLAAAQQEFNRNSLPEITVPLDEDYEHAVSAVEQKRVEIAQRASLGMSTTADKVDLQRLEEKLLLAQKNKSRSEKHARQVREASIMFFAEGEASDGDDDRLSQPPPRVDQPIDLAVLDVSSGDEHDTPKEDTNPSRKRKYERKQPVASKNAKKPKTSRRAARTPIEMLNMGSLIRNDVVADAKANQGLRRQPALGEGGNKQKALVALLASIPEDERDSARGEKAALDKACKVFCYRGRGSMQAHGEKGWRLKGMASSLKHFQLLSVANGVEKERGSAAPFGGMLADTMGYGKTIQMITIMVENQPDRNARNKTTLVVVPASITSQWVEEIAKHVDDGVMEHVSVYKSGCRPADDETVRFLRRQQVVITTYHEVMRNFPKSDPPIHLTTDTAKDKWWDKYYEENKGPLLQMKFHRIILDEAHIIKNHESRTSKACRLLSSKYRWVITGTPLSNRLEEMYPYFNFLGVQGSGTFAQFQQNYAKRTDITSQRLDAILKAVMIRRTGSSRLFGAPLVSLPALDHQTITIDFNPVEKAIYSVVRQRFIARINDWSRSNKLNQVSKNIFVMLTRLRQMCAHVLMISTTMRDLLESEDIEKLWKSIERNSASLSESGRKTVRILKRIVKGPRDEDTPLESTPEPYVVDNHDDTVDLTIDDGDFDYRDFFYQLQRDGAWEKIRNRSHCCLCAEIPEEEHCRLSVPCGHLYCEDCISGKLQEQMFECSACQNPMTGAADLLAMDQIASEARQKSQRAFGQENAQPKKKGRKGKEDPDAKWLNNPGIDRLSSKAQAIESTIADWMDNDPDAKIVVFTLWIPMLKILGKVCSRRGWGYAEYSGKFSADQRNRSLRKWKDPANKQRVLLMSMRAGGLGLNLVEASYCCIVDPWWNEPAEDQAFSRVYRIGQSKDCVVRRFLIKDAIDTQLMLHLQKVKAEECERVVDGRRDKITVHDVMRWFGPIKKDPRTGQPIIEDGKDVNDEFIISSESVVIDDSEDERVMPAPARPREE